MLAARDRLPSRTDFIIQNNDFQPPRTRKLVEGKTKHQFLQLSSVAKRPRGGKSKLQGWNFTKLLLCVFSIKDSTLMTYVNQSEWDSENSKSYSSRLSFIVNLSLQLLLREVSYIIASLSTQKYVNNSVMRKHYRHAAPWVWASETQLLTATSCWGPSPP